MQVYKEGDNVRPAVAVKAVDTKTDADDLDVAQPVVKARPEGKATAKATAKAMKGGAKAEGKAKSKASKAGGHQSAASAQLPALPQATTGVQTGDSVSPSVAAAKQTSLVPPAAAHPCSTAAAEPVATAKAAAGSKARPAAQTAPAGRKQQAGRQPAGLPAVATKTPAVAGEPLTHHSSMLGLVSGFLGFWVPGLQGPAALRSRFGTCHVT